MDTEAPSPYRGKELDEILKMVEGETTQATRGREVNRIMGKDTHVLAQVLGFKFGYYQVGSVHKTLKFRGLTGGHCSCLMFLKSVLRAST